MANPVAWFEIPAPDFEAAKTFYQNVFEVEIQPMPMGPDMMGFFPGGPELSGATGAIVSGPAQVPNPDGITIYFVCGDSLTPYLDRAVQNGAEVVIPRTEIGEFGVFAQFKDPQGNRIGLHSNG